MQTQTPAVLDVKHFVGAQEFDVSRDFYIAMGWELTYDSPGLRVLQLSGHRFYLQNYYCRDWCENSMLHIAVADVDAWFEFATRQFTEHNFGGQARLGDSPKDEGYARVFYVWDPSGVLLHFAQLADTTTSD